MSIRQQRLCWLLLFCLVLPANDPLRVRREPVIARRLARNAYAGRRLRGELPN